MAMVVRKKSTQVFAAGWLQGSKPNSLAPSVSCQVLEEGGEGARFGGNSCTILLHFVQFHTW